MNKTLSKHQIRTVAKLLAATAFAFLLWGCGSDKSADPISYSPTFTNVYNVILNSNTHSCSFCHNPSGQATTDYNVELDFSSYNTAWSTLTQKFVTSSTKSGTCGTVKIVDSTPETSYLAAVLISTYNQTNFAGVSGCTPYNVHLDDINLSTAEKNLITGWINDGSKAN